MLLKSRAFFSARAIFLAATVKVPITVHLCKAAITLLEEKHNWIFSLRNENSCSKDLFVSYFCAHSSTQLGEDSQGRTARTGHQDRTARQDSQTGQPDRTARQDSQTGQPDRTARQDSQTGHPEQDNQNRTFKTGQAEHDRQNRTGIIGQNWTGRTGQTEQDRQNRIAEELRQNRAAWTGLHGQHRLDRRAHGTARQD